MRSSPGTGITDIIAPFAIDNMARHLKTVLLLEGARHESADAVFLPIRSGSKFFHSRAVIPAQEVRDDC